MLGGNRRGRRPYCPRQAHPDSGVCPELLLDATAWWFLLAEFVDNIGIMITLSRFQPLRVRTRHERAQVVSVAQWAAMVTLAAALAILSTPDLAPGATEPLRGDYLGQAPPGREPRLFAPGIVSTEADEYAFELSPAGDEILFTRDGALWLATRQPDGFWTDPAIAPFSGRHVDGESCYAPDGRRIYFSSRRPLPGAKHAANLWVCDKLPGGWGQPRALRGLGADKSLHAVSIAANGTIYDSGIVRFRPEGAGYGPAEALTPPTAGGWPFVAPDESYIIFGQRPAGPRAPDLHIIFQKADGTWTAPIRLENGINTPGIEGNPFVTADGAYLFFSRQFDVYWVRADFIGELRLRAGESESE